ncbi:MAG: hypothetical protein P8X64_11005 [Anaerolineales bacterium]|jgi:hypothetical protein
MKSLPDVTYVPYQQWDERPERAAIYPISVSMSGLSESEVQLVGHLIEAVEGINPIYRHQFDRRTQPLRQLLQALGEAASGEERQLLENHLTLIDFQNGPFAMLPRKNSLLSIPADRLTELAAAAGEEFVQQLDELRPLLHDHLSLHPTANFYPDDISEAELEQLGETRNLVNSRIVRDHEAQLSLMLNEHRYRNTLKPVLMHLRAARDLAEDLDFRLYLDAKIVELESGSTEARRLSDTLWIRHKSPIDFVLSTALEVYLDGFRNARGAACGCIYLQDEGAQARADAILALMPEFEASAPWEHKRARVDMGALPRLRFVNVLAWAGDYIGSPGAVLAQSLPNDQWVAEHIGTVNNVFSNISLLTAEHFFPPFMQAMLTESVWERSLDQAAEASLLHYALHEIGHATGAMDPDHRQGQPSDYLEAEYSYLEELRAELFGLWAIETLVQHTIIDRELADASLVVMLGTLLSSLRFDPEQAHNKARNAMFHWFSQQEMIRRIESPEGVRFEFDMSTVRKGVTRLLAEIGNIRAAGDKDAAAEFRQRYVFTDPLKDEIKRRTSHMPVGGGILFPSLAKQDGRYTGELSYPAGFSQQALCSLQLLDSLDG